MGAIPVVYANRIVVHKEGKKIKGYYGWASQGDLANTDDEYQPKNIWYKVKNETIEGWVLGLVSVF